MLGAARLAGGAHPLLCVAESLVQERLAKTFALIRTCVPCDSVPHPPPEACGGRPAGTSSRRRSCRSGSRLRAWRWTGAPAPCSCGTAARRTRCAPRSRPRPPRVDPTVTCSCHRPCPVGSPLTILQRSGCPALSRLSGAAREPRRDGRLGVRVLAAARTCGQGIRTRVGLNRPCPVTFNRSNKVLKCYLEALRFIDSFLLTCAERAAGARECVAPCGVRVHAAGRAGRAGRPGAQA